MVDPLPLDRIVRSDRWDWWLVPRAWADDVGYYAPGIVIHRDGRVEVHRTHLPLFAAAGYPVPAGVEREPPEVVRGVELRPWQRRATAWAEDRRGTLIVAEPRMGKTALALTLHDPSTGPLVIFAPLDVRAVWLAWVERVFPGANVMCLEGHEIDVAGLRRADVVISHYDILAWQRISGVSIGTLIIDEIHLLSNPTSERAKAARFFAPLARRVISLTGTPLWNHISGLWPVLAATNPGAWGSTPFHFKQRYCSPTVTEHGWKYGEVSHVDEWRARCAEVVFAASWRVERPDLPPTIRRTLAAQISDDDLLHLDELAATFRGGAGDTTIGAISRYRKATGMLKVPTAAARALAISADEPVVVWGWHKEVIKAIAKITAKAGRATFMIHGDRAIPAAERVRRIDAWRQEPRGVLCATLAVGQVGIDLSHARRAIMTEMDWTPVVDYQGEMRTFDPARVMLIDYIAAGHPVEVMVTDHVVRKLERAEAAAMPAAGSDFSIASNDWDDGDLLAELDGILAHSSARFDDPVGGSC